MGDVARDGVTTTAAGGGDGFVECADGRRLAFREYGAVDGAPVFNFHGWPGSRLDFAANDAAAGVRVVAVDRPGMGGSDFQRRRRVLDWPADVAAVADAFGLDRFAVLGFSFRIPARARVRVCAGGTRHAGDPRLERRPAR